MGNSKTWKNLSLAAIGLFIAFSPLSANTGTAAANGAAEAKAISTVSGQDLRKDTVMNTYGLAGKLVDEQKRTYQDKMYSSLKIWDKEFLAHYNNPDVYPAIAIAFAPGADETSFNFSWYSPKTNFPGVIQYAKITEGVPAEFPEKAEVAAAALDKASFGFAAHEATITGIEQASEYVYRLGDGKGKWSEMYSFKTRNADAYNFLLMGDPQIGASGDVAEDRQGWENTLNKAIEKFPDASFIQSAGDQVDYRSSEKEFVAYFAPEALRQYPTATTIGNHDYNKYYEYHFNVPNQNPELGNYDNSGGDYYFTYGDTLIMNLNSNNDKAEEHIQFMNETIEATADRDFKWKFVVFHHSIYSAAAHSDAEKVIKLRESLVPAIDELDIDAVLMGHDHSYVRTYQMKALQPLKNHMVQNGSVVNPEGTVYFTANSSSGSKYYAIEPDPEPYAAVRNQLETTTFTNVAVTATSLEFTTYRADTMEAVDSYKIIKDPAIPVVVPALEKVELEVTGNVLPVKPISLYPEVVLKVKGTNVEGAQYDILPEQIEYKADREGQVSFAADGKVSLAENAELGEVKVWAEVAIEGETFKTEETTLSIVDQEEQQFIEKNSEWSYLDDGSDQGTEWKEPEFDDSDWDTGNAPLGYPEDEEHERFGKIETEIGYGSKESDKFATSYFRTEFEVEDLDSIGDLGFIDFTVDDSVILYLNGQEIGRFNLPEGDISFDDYLYDVADKNLSEEGKVERIRLDENQLDHLVEGRNVLAAEVHQDDAQSSDLYWDMELITAIKSKNE
ncbi:metallophosphoesterase family protein [Planococcus shenhongbingii]|uniref:purple acid phosphatase family protein n=1 Tax=Planococcus shenhongbingii TaxID=3058398 RepID=UPI00260AC446|nr:metallophosphoesterase family protein [Planococcus sp. N016]WKA58146.1 metallophosphoesterase family protein [Planococcus sp. N016]